MKEGLQERVKLLKSLFEESEKQNSTYGDDNKTSVRYEQGQ